jgi:hypothetical protein
MPKTPAATITPTPATVEYAAGATIHDMKKTKCIVIVTKLSQFIVGTIPTLMARLQRANHRPQLCPQRCNHHDEVRKNVIPYGVGLTGSIGYCRNRLANRKTAIIVKMTLHVGIRKK